MGTAVSIALRVLLHVIYSEHFTRFSHEVLRAATKEVIRHIQRRTHESKRYAMSRGEQ